MSYLDQQFDLRDLIADLPPNIKQAVGEIDVVSEIYRIGDQFELLISEIGDLCEETAKVIAGETRPENFIENLHSKLGEENKNKANQIGSEINNKILIPIREAYKKTAMGDQPTTDNLQQTTREGTQTTSDVTGYPEGKSTSYGAGKLQDKSSPDVTDTEPTFHQPFDRDFIMYEIENPTPTGVSTMPYGQETTGQNLNQPPMSRTALDIGQPPINLPTESEPKMEVPVIRTMPNDIKSFTNNNLQPTHLTFVPQKLGGQATYNQPIRGKFGQGTPPMIRQNRQSESLEIPNSKAQIPRQTFEGQKLSGQAKSSENQNVKKETVPNVTKSPSFIPTGQGMIGGTIRGNPQPMAGNPEGKSTSYGAGLQQKPRSNLDIQTPVPPQNTNSPKINNSEIMARTAGVVQSGGETKNPSTPSFVGNPIPIPQQPKAEQSNPLPIPQKPPVSPTPTPQKTTFQIPQPEQSFKNPNKPTDESFTKQKQDLNGQKADKIDSMVENKLTNTVGIPSERKRYVIDPYREPLE